MGQFQRINGLIDNCRATLKEQIMRISTGEYAELQQWQESYIEIHALLQQSFQLLDTQGASQREVDCLKTNVEELVGLNNRLHGAAAEQRQIISERLSHIRKGKSALGGYSSRVQKTKPRFLSSNG